MVCLVSEVFSFIIYDAFPSEFRPPRDEWTDGGGGYV
jgi:hypothetical protein